MIPVCKHDALPITRHTASARRSPTGWSHALWGGWEGIRCPGRLTGAEPSEDLPADAEYRITMDEVVVWRAKAAASGGGDA